MTRTPGFPSGAQLLTVQTALMASSKNKGVRLPQEQMKPNLMMKVPS